MVRVNGSLWRNRFRINTTSYNAVLDCKFSDSSPAAGGGAQVLNTTESGASFQNDDLIGATVYLLFADGPNFVQVYDILDLDPDRKQFYFNSTTGTVTFSYTIADPIDITVFYTSPGTSALPAVEPVTLAEAKAYMKIDTGTVDDSIITELITSAREQCEDYSGLSIVARTVTTILNNSCGGIFLPYGPVIAVSSFKDSEGDEIDPDDYTLSGLDFPQIISPAYDRLKLVYTAGYGIPPKRIKTAILQQVFYLYQNRGETADITRFGEVQISLSPQAKSTLNRLRRV